MVAGLGTIYSSPSDAVGRPPGRYHEAPHLLKSPVLIKVKEKSMNFQETLIAGPGYVPKRVPHAEILEQPLGMRDRIRLLGLQLL